MKALTFQELIKKLKDYWSEQGCVVAEPYGIEVGAGTNNPQTYFRVLGPEPWSVVYVEPSRRPDDSRYGLNPFRLQHYFQLQVILKPAPKDNIDLYLESLKAIGIDRTIHDVRFVEDNWEAPSIGAWGLGWEVWLNGMEVSQYTYFQQVGGIDLDPVSVEITYGLERIAMYLQNVDHYKDIMWDKRVKYGDIFERQEHWVSTYNLDTADITRNREMLKLFEQEAESQLKHKNHRAAYDNLLKMSHIFNILDARSAVGVTERANTFRKMQNFSKNIAELYLDERKKLKYPLMQKK